MTTHCRLGVLSGPAEMIKVARPHAPHRHLGLKKPVRKNSPDIPEAGGGCQALMGARCRGSMVPGAVGRRDADLPSGVRSGKVSVRCEGLDSVTNELQRKRRKLG